MNKVACKEVIYMTLILLFSMMYFPEVSAQTWKNPMTMDNEWSQYGMGDPYVFKYKGVFYLYVSTKNREIGAKCWSSVDLVDWKYEGNVTDDATTLGAYAPEVMYWNGKFYMYSSPRGRGHYVYQSDSPTGPFVIATNNFGKTIDGSVFIDDDGKWYFYHASDKGIQAAEMSTPLTFGESSITGALMNNAWTEGATVIKRNGIYHMAYTGNHINSRGYRIDYASSKSSPVNNFQPHQDQNPIILATEEDAFKGLGHGTMFIGPDLDSYYLTYHNHVSRSGPIRQYNFDRIAWNGDKMRVLGPTNFSQQSPELPDVYDYFNRVDIGKDWEFPNNGQWSIVDQDYLFQNSLKENGDQVGMAVLSTTSEDNFTAEFNFKETARQGSNAKLGAIVNYFDAKNYGIFTVNNDSKKLGINFMVNGRWGTEELVDILPDLDFTEWQTMKIEKFGTNYKIFIHDLLIHEIKREMPKGKIGYFSSACKGAFGFIALSNNVQGSAIFDVYKPIPGSFDAVHYNSEGEGNAYHETSQGISKLYIRKDNVEMVESGLGGYAVANIKTGEWLKYNVNIESTREFNVQITYATSVSGNQIKLSLDDIDISGVIELPEVLGSEWGSIIIKGLKMTAGYHVLKLEAVSGNFDFYSLKFEKASNKSFSLMNDFNTGIDSLSLKYADGDWSLSNGALMSGSFGKYIIGDYEWSDYSIEADINYVTGTDAGLIFRARNPSQGRSGNSPEAG
ncbi:MAG: hypothetical protein B7Z06_05525, partial [Flavobacteriales bacterium 32-35-8]